MGPRDRAAPRPAAQRLRARRDLPWCCSAPTGGASPSRRRQPTWVARSRSSTSRPASTSVTPIPGQTLRYLDDGRIVVGVGQTLELWRPDATAPAKFATPLDGAITAPGVMHWLSPTTVYGLPADLGFPGVPAAAPSPAAEWDVSTGKPVGDLLGGRCSRRHRGAPTPSSTRDARCVEGGRQGRAVGHRSLSAQLRCSTRASSSPSPRGTPPGRSWRRPGLDGTLALWDTSDVAHVRLLARTAVPGHIADSQPYRPLQPRRTHDRCLQPRVPGSRTPVRSPTPLSGTSSGPASSSIGAVFTSDSKTVAISDSQLHRRRPRRPPGCRDRPPCVPRWRCPTPSSSLWRSSIGDQWLVTVQGAQGRGVNPDSVQSRVDIWDATTLQQVGVPIPVSGDAGWVEVDRPGGSRLRVEHDGEHWYRHGLGLRSCALGA